MTIMGHRDALKSWKSLPMGLPLRSSPTLEHRSYLIPAGSLRMTPDRPDTRLLPCPAPLPCSAVWSSPACLATSSCSAASSRPRAAPARKKLKPFRACPQRSSSTSPVRDWPPASEAGPPKGEIVLLVGPPLETQATEADLDTALLEALGRLPVKAAANEVATLLDVSKRIAYQRALALKDQDAGND